LRVLVRSDVAGIVVSKYLSSAIRDSDGPGNSVALRVNSGVYADMFRFGNSPTGRKATVVPTARHMPIVAITANAFDDDRRKCFEAGMDGYVVKPVSAKAISDEVSRVMALFNQAQRETVEK
jgi:PleD family two-component response regulator